MIPLSPASAPLPFPFPLALALALPLPLAAPVAESLRAGFTDELLPVPILIMTAWWIHENRRGFLGQERRVENWRVTILGAQKTQRTQKGGGGIQVRSTEIRKPNVPVRSWQSPDGPVNIHTPRLAVRQARTPSWGLAERREIDNNDRLTAYTRRGALGTGGEQSGSAATDCAGWD